MGATAGHASADACPIGAGPCGSRRDARRARQLLGIDWRTRLALALVVFVAACGAPPPARCTIDDLDDHMVSTRAVFLERLAGCPIGGRN